MQLCDGLHQEEDKGVVRHTDVQAGAVGRRAASSVAITALAGH